MSLEHSPARGKGAMVDLSTPGAPDSPNDPGFWHQLIDEKAAAAFLDLTDRTLQGLRQKGGGPHFIRLSSRCIRYRRIDLKAWADERIRTSTSDTGA